MQRFARTVVEHRQFQPVVMGIIILASLLVGLETYPNLRASYGQFFHFLDLTIQALFTIEISVRILAYGNKPLAFFRSVWNVFDFAVTAFFYLPFGGSFTSVLRLVRILRVLRLVTALKITAACRRSHKEYSVNWVRRSPSFCPVLYFRDHREYGIRQTRSSSFRRPGQVHDYPF